MRATFVTIIKKQSHTKINSTNHSRTMLRTMNCILLCTILAVASCITVNAEATDSSTRRQLRYGKTVICRSVSPLVHETMVVDKVTELLYIATKRAVKGNCRNINICKKLCNSYDSYTTTNTQCRCLVEATPLTNTTITTDTANTTTTTTAAPVAPITKQPTKAPIRAPVARKPTTAPTVAPIGTTKTEFCSNPYGNPCGPGSACTDTATGISCAPINTETCPVGCGPNSTCLLQSSSQRYECICDAGFSRPRPYLPCVANR